MYEQYVKQVLVDPSKHRVLQIMDTESEYLLCYFFESQRAVWLHYSELKDLAASLQNKKDKPRPTETQL